MLPPAFFYQTQDQSIFAALNAGIRAFDLRVGNSPDGQSIIFYHATAMLDGTTTLEVSTGLLFKE
jgi:hypothetical protein